MSGTIISIIFELLDTVYYTTNTTVESLWKAQPHLHTCTARPRHAELS